MSLIQTSLPRWPGWRNLPRETRDTLFLLGVIGWTVLPHVEHLPWWSGALTGLVLVWRAHLALAGVRLPGRMPVIVLLVISLLLTLWSEQTVFGKEAGVTMLVMLVSLKTLELRARRDALVVFFLGFFLVLTHFLYSQSLLTALAMLLSVWGLLTALVLAHMPVGKPPLAQAGRLAARSALLGAPLMILLFVLFPRMGPLWGMPQDGLGRTGLSGTLRLGGVAEVANDDSIAFRVRFDEGEGLPPESLYFRGPVLSVFDGIEWRRRPIAATAMAGATGRGSGAVRTIGIGVGYETTLEPIRLALIPVLEATPDSADAAPRIDGWTLRMRPDLQWQTDRIVTERLRFSARAWPRFEHGQTLPEEELRELVQLPQGYNPRVQAWAADFKRAPELAGADARRLVNAVMAHVRSAGYTYTLTPGTYGRDSIDEFWLDRRSGFCEHFATAFVVVMRAMGVPARVVTGYQGADPRPIDGYFVVRQSHAHAWAEYWMPGRGWQRADPTAAVAPDRVVRSLSLTPDAGLVANALRTVNPELLTELRAGWEAVNNRWNQWVLNYSRTQQFDLLQRLGVRAPDWQDLGVLLIGLLSTGALAGAAWAFWDRRRQDPWQKLQRNVREALATLGIAAQSHQPPRQLASLVRQHFGVRSHPLAVVLDDLDRARYARNAQRRPDPEWWRRFSLEVYRLRRTG